MFGDGKDSLKQIETCYSNQPSDPLSDRDDKNIKDRWRKLKEKAAEMEPPMEIDTFMNSQEYLEWNPN